MAKRHYVVEFVAAEGGWTRPFSFSSDAEAKREALTFLEAQHAVRPQPEMRIVLLRAEADALEPLGAWILTPTGPATWRDAY